MKKLLLLCLIGTFITNCGKCVDANYSVIPLPNNIEANQGDAFTLSKYTYISYPKENSELENVAELLSEYIKESTQYKIKSKSYGSTAPKKGIILSLGLDHPNKEAYEISINENSISIKGASEAGVFYGCQFIRKSIPAVAIGNDISFTPLTVLDYPRFGYRGQMFDVCRHFYTIEEVKKRIDIMALHNLNTMHWHLTEDQGWRIEIKKYPKLIEIGSKRPCSVINRTGVYDSIPVSGYYTQEEIRDVIEYAKKRYITIIPEIDLPGHMVAALASYPHMGCTGGPYEVRTRWGIAEEVLCAGNEEAMVFLEDVLDEVSQLFPSEYIHIGGDECPKNEWKKCPKCQAKIKELKIKANSEHTSEEFLQSYVITRMTKFLNSKGKKVIGWDEILEGGAPQEATIMSWRGVKGGVKAAQMGNNVIMTPNIFLYFDYYQTLDKDKEPFYQIGGFLPTEKVYSFDPALPELTPEEQSRILGVQGNLWTEFLKTEEQRDYMTLPRVAALSEIGWTQPERKNWKNFLDRLAKLIETYERENWNYAKHLLEVAIDLTPNTSEETIKVALTTLGSNKIYYTLDGTEPNENSNLYTVPFSITPPQSLKAVAIASNNWRSSIAKVETISNKATLKPIVFNIMPHSNYGYNGATTLVDGIIGPKTYNSGHWIGFHKDKGLDATIDLTKATNISSVIVETITNTGDHVLNPKSITIEVSDDNKTFEKVAHLNIPDNEKLGVYTESHKISFPIIKTQYVRVKAETSSPMPKWHPRAGKDAFIFVGEICIN